MPTNWIRRSLKPRVLRRLVDFSFALLGVLLLIAIGFPAYFQWAPVRDNFAPHPFNARILKWGPIGRDAVILLNEAKGGETAGALRSSADGRELSPTS